VTQFSRFISCKKKPRDLVTQLPVTVTPFWPELCTFNIGNVRSVAYLDEIRRNKRFRDNFIRRHSIVIAFTYMGTNDHRTTKTLLRLAYHHFHLYERCYREIASCKDIAAMSDAGVRPARGEQRQFQPFPRTFIICNLLFSYLFADNHCLYASVCALSDFLSDFLYHCLNSRSIYLKVYYLNVLLVTTSPESCWICLWRYDLSQ